MVACHGGLRALHDLFQRPSYRGRRLIGWPSCKARLPCGESSSALWPLSRLRFGWLVGEELLHLVGVGHLDEENKPASRRGWD